MNKILVLLMAATLLTPLASTLRAESQPVYEVLRCDFHVHTTYSDGHLTPTQVVDLYKSYGYDAIAITDHNWNRGWAEAEAEGLAQNLTVIRGEEMSYYWADGSYKHIVGLFLSSNIGYNYRWNRNDVVQPIFDAIHARGGIGIAAHPECNYPKLSHLDWWRLTNATYIDGWEYSTQQRVSTVPTYNEWLLGSGDLMLYDHDYHYNNSTLSTIYTLVLAHNNTAAGVREALESRRTLVYNGGAILGEQWVIDAYNYSLNPNPPPYTVTITDGTQPFSITVANQTEYARLIEYLRAGNWTVEAPP
jgi:hypothetical protein